MCGMVCYSSGRVFQEALIQTMNDTLSHRGPDDSGHVCLIDNDKQIALGHKRLSILDLSTNGQQPMYFEHLIIVFNGEIYNHLEIRKRLEAENYDFQSTSDTETLLKAFHKWGVGCLELLNGMFAFAVYDKQRRELFLARDRLGIKPLYYYHHGNSFVFASELKAIMKFPDFKKDINFQAVTDYFTRRYITKPHTIFNRTFKLEAGHYLRYSGNELTKQSYWSLGEKFCTRRIDPKRSKDDYLDEFDALLQKSVKYRMLSDVPIGSFLSGGYDSSLVTGMMQQLSHKPVRSFSIGFNESQYNEGHYAKKVAAHLGTDHHELYFSADKVKEIIPRIPDIVDEPFSDSSLLPTILLSEFTRGSVTVALSGDGGDELFCGYDHYYQDLKNQKYLLAGKLFGSLGRLRGVPSLIDRIDRRLLKFFYFQDKNAMINSHFAYSGEFYFNGLVKGHSYQMASQYGALLDATDNIQEKHMLQDMNNFLPEDILTKVDRASMYYGLEVRTPLLDHHLVEFSFSVPHELKYHQGELKYLLKELAYRRVPRELLDRPKAGFIPPIEKWLRSDLSWLLDEYLSYRYLTSQDIFDVKKLRRIVERSKNENDRFFSCHLWSIIVFQMGYAKPMYSNV